MKKVLSAVSAVFLLGACAQGMVASGQVQNATPATSEMATRGGVGDPRTRAKLHTELGSMYFQDGNMAVALEELDAAIAIDSGYAPAFNVRALVHAYLREMGAADRDFQQALRLVGNDPEVNNNYGWFLCQSNREKDSIEYFLRAIKNPLYQTPDRAYLNAGLCSKKIGDLGAAEDYFQKTLRVSPDNSQATFQLAGINYQRGNAGEAKRLLAAVMRRVEPSAEVLWLALRIERKLGDRAAEASYATRLRRNFSGSPEYQELLKGNFE